MAAQMMNRSPSKPLRWQDDRAFVAWLVSQQYAGQIGLIEGLEVKPYMTLGTMLYLHEAWLAGIQNGKTRQAD